MTKTEDTLRVVNDWWNALPTYSQNNGLPAKGTVAGALVVLERLKKKYVLEIDQHRTKGRSQIAGAGKTSTQKILASFGETRNFGQEAGRTNRGLARDIAQLLNALKAAELENLSIAERNTILNGVQKWLVDKVGEYFNRKRVSFNYYPQNSTWQSICEILEQAKSVGKEGPVAQYLVGAKLTLRFPEVSIRNDSYSTSDVQSGNPGDFLVGDTVFHVTVAPMPGHYEKCQTNVSQGYSVYLIVPYRVMTGSWQYLDSVAPGRITVQSIESFVSQNIDELTSFSKEKLISGFRRLLEVYNERVDSVETDKSMLIEIPRNLLD